MRLFKRVSIFNAMLLMITSIFIVGVKAESVNSILNYDKNLGIFRDLTQTEVVDYYSDLKKGDKGDSLLGKLQDILKQGQIKLKYDSGDTTSTAWSGYYLLERNWEKSPLTDKEISSQKYEKTDIWMNILYATNDIYIEDKINGGTFKYNDLTTNELKSISYKNGSTQFDREHVLPKSYGFNGDNDRYKNLTAGCDMQNLHAGEHNGNSAGHSNYPYGNVEIHDKDTAIVSGITGEVIGYTGNNKNGVKVFEPLDIDKGDIARTVFYMCARYHKYEELGGGDNTPAITLRSDVSRPPTTDPEETKDNPVACGELDDLLEWNIIDPVDEFEIHRNNLCYNAIQYNRNPFVDYPEWVNVCFDENTEYGIDLNSANGVDGNTEYGLLINGGVNPIYKYSKFDFSTLSFTYRDTENTIDLSLSDLSYTVKYNNALLDIPSLNDYEFALIGDYAIEFEYKISEEIYSKVFTLKVISPYSIELSKDNPIDTIKAEWTKEIDLTTLKFVLLNKGTEVGELSDYIIEILDSDGNVVSDNGKYKFDKFGTYTVNVKSTQDNDVIISSFTINVQIPMLYLIIAAIVIAIILLIILIIVLNVKKKNKKKSKKNKSKKKR